MTTVNVYGQAGFLFTPFNTNQFFDYVNWTQVSPDVVQFFSDDGRVMEYTGTGLVLNANGELTAGMITSIDYIVSGVYVFTLDGLSVDAAAFFQDCEAGNIAPAFDALFAGADTFYGSAGDDSFSGGSGIDFVMGGAGNDLLEGYDAESEEGSGYDILSYEFETGTSGVIVDMIAGTATDTYGDTDSVADFEDIRGSAYNDTILASNEDDVLFGFAGSDILDGRLGLDTAVYEWDQLHGGMQGIVASLVTGVVTDTFGDTDTLSGIENISGSIFNDTITGNGQDNGIAGRDGNDHILGGAGLDDLAGEGGDDRLEGGSDNDIMNGGAGTDVMIGGAGDDYYILDTNLDSTIEGTNAGIDTVEASASHTLRANVENLVLTGTANLGGTGNTLNNDIIGNSGSNILNGKTGADTMTGGVGDDTYYTDHLSDATIEFADEGIDIVRSTLNWTLGSDIEKLYVTGTATDGTGNELSNYIYGNSLNNTIDGGIGADRLYGYGGNDVFIADSTGDLVYESAGAGTDEVLASVNFTLAVNVENLTLTGAAGISGSGNDAANVITGNGGNNFLYGKLGNDTLTGAGGNDQFVFNSALGAANVDTITDFSSVNDTIRIDDAVFTGMTVGYLAASAFVVGPAALDANDRIIYDDATGAVYFDVDGSGGAAAVQFAILAAGLTLSNADFYIA
jgi:Ca2+-binding RTX toxin-like protein